MANLALTNLEPRAREQLGYASEFMAAAQQQLQKAMEELTAAAAAAEDVVNKRKITSMEASVRGQRNDVERTKLAIAERLGINVDPDCICGQSSRCPIHQE